MHTWQAVSRARQDLKFLLVYVHSPSHQDTAKFCREVICNQQLIDFVADQLLVWGISVHSEEGVSQHTIEAQLILLYTLIASPGQSVLHPS